MSKRKHVSIQRRMFHGHDVIMLRKSGHFIALPIDAARAVMDAVFDLIENPDSAKPQAKVQTSANSKHQLEQVLTENGKTMAIRQNRKHEC